MIRRNRLMASTLAVLAIASSGYSIKANAATTDATTATTTSAGTTVNTSSNVQIYAGWQKVKDSAGADIWYFYQGGNKVTGDYTINGVTYHFDTVGKLTDNAIIDNGYPVGIKSINATTNNGWVRGQDDAHRDTWFYYKDGVKVTGEQFIEGTHYFFDREGEIVTDAWVVNGVLTDNFEPQFRNSTHYYDCNGIQARGWCNMGESYANNRGGWMYFDQNGIQEKGWVESNHKLYYMDMNSGYMRTGWMQLDNIWFHFDKSGAMQTGWVYDNGTWYYMNKNGVMQTGWQKVNGKWYFLNSNGSMKTGWLKNAGSWYHLGDDGAMQTGWIKDGSSWYFLYNNGIMAESCMIGNYHVNASGAWDR